MTERLYYRDSFLMEFEAELTEVPGGSRPALILDRTAFYPASGGQVCFAGATRAMMMRIKRERHDGHGTADRGNELRRLRGAGG